jgi:hypothetical protein
VRLRLPRHAWSIDIGLEEAAAGLLALCVVCFTLGSGSVQWLRSVGHDLRWPALVALWLVAVALALQRRNLVLRGLIAAVVWLGGVLVGLMVVSAVWSTKPRLTFERSVSFAILITAAGALAVTAAARPRFARMLLGAIVAGVGFVVVLGFVVLIVDPSAAAQVRSTFAPWRFRGVGENPNTVSMLAGLTTPLMLWAVFETEGGRRQALIAALALGYATIALSASRGALLAAVVGTLALCLALRPRLVAVRVAGATVGAFFVAIAVSQIPKPLATPVVIAPVQTTTTATTPATTATTSTSTVLTTTVSTTTTPTSTGPGSTGTGPTSTGPPSTVTTSTVPTSTGPTTTASRTTTGPGSTTTTTTTPAGPPRVVVVTPAAPGASRLEDESGPLALRRSLFGSSGRAQAWQGAIDQANEAPLLGYGFGTEDSVFLDHYAAFQSGRPENSLIGLYLQLGLVGLVLFVALGLTLVAAGIRAVRAVPEAQRAFVGACLAAVAGGIVLMLFQSYVYAAGNLSAASFWTCALLLAAAGSWARTRA